MKRTIAQGPEKIRKLTQVWNFTKNFGVKYDEFRSNHQMLNHDPGAWYWEGVKKLDFLGNSSPVRGRGSTVSFSNNIHTFFCFNCFFRCCPLKGLRGVGSQILHDSTYRFRAFHHSRA